MTKSCTILKRCVLVVLAALLFASCVYPQFVDDFRQKPVVFGPGGVNGWAFFTGDGFAVMNFRSAKGCASIDVDATKDKRGIWWALIRRRVSQDLDLSLLGKPKYELRIEAKIRVSHAPRRVNLHLNTQRTTNFHTHLMEFDIPDTVDWHIISMTTHDFDAVPGDSVYGQLALMDWGSEKYRVDIQYFKVDIVDTDSAGKDIGIQTPYHPPAQDPATFGSHIEAAQDCIIDTEYTDVNFNDWRSQDEYGNTYLLTVDGTRYIVLRWDLSEYAGKKAAGTGLLELTTYSLQRSPEYIKDFGMIRVHEIIGGNSGWKQEEVTFNNLCRGKPLYDIINSQMIIDMDVAGKKGEKNFIVISNPVLQRMIDGKTLGLIIRPLGAVAASFYSTENKNEKLSAKLHLNIGSDPAVHK